MNTGLGIVFRLVAVSMCAVFVVGIVAYNGMLDVRHQFSALRDRVEKLQTANAELKNDLYALTDAKTLSAVALRLGLVAEQNPQYLNVREGSIIAQRN